MPKPPSKSLEPRYCRLAPSCGKLLVKRPNEWLANFLRRKTCGCACAIEVSALMRTGETRRNMTKGVVDTRRKSKRSATEIRQMDEHQLELNARARAVMDRISTAPLDTIRWRCPQAACLLGPQP